MTTKKTVEIKSIEKTDARAVKRAEKLKTAAAMEEMGMAGVTRLTRDMVKAAATMSDDEARYLVDTYYMRQEDRKRSGNQVRALDENKEPHTVLGWLSDQNVVMEGQVKRALDEYTKHHPMGAWMRSIFGIGPVISAGLLAHIDIEKAETAGHIWRFAGLDPSVKWWSTEDTKRYVQERLVILDAMGVLREAAVFFGRDVDTLIRHACTDSNGNTRTPTTDNIAKAISRQPWNATLRTLAWKIGQSFMKQSGDEQCYYGHLYIERKQMEVQKNEDGRNADTAKSILASRNFGNDTDAKKWLSGRYPKGTMHKMLMLDAAKRPAYLASVLVEPGKGQHMLPPAQVDGRARRWVAKLFLAHLQEVWYFQYHGRPAPRPYVIDHAGHAHVIRPQNTHLVPGFDDAMKGAKHYLQEKAA